MLQSLAHSLRVRACSVLGGAWWHPAAAALVNQLPGVLCDWFYTIGGYYEAAPRRKVQAIDVENIAAWMIDHYPTGRRSAIALGSSNGAFVH